MQGLNVIWVFDRDAARVLMCKRHKEPYLGLYNLVGGKIEPGEDGLAAAYRELEEETGITDSDITLTHLMDFTYYLSDCRVEVYVGKLSRDMEVRGDEKELVWMTAITPVHTNPRILICGEATPLYTFVSTANTASMVIPGVYPP